jgi:hypothetical protein
MSAIGRFMSASTVIGTAGMRATLVSVFGISSAPNVFITGPWAD